MKVCACTLRLGRQSVCKWAGLIGSISGWGSLGVYEGEITAYVVVSSWSLEVAVVSFPLLSSNL